MQPASRTVDKGSEFVAYSTPKTGISDEHLASYGKNVGLVMPGVTSMCSDEYRYVPPLGGRAAATRRRHRMSKIRMDQESRLVRFSHPTPASFGSTTESPRKLIARLPKSERSHSRWLRSPRQRRSESRPPLAMDTLTASSATHAAATAWMRYEPGSLPTIQGVAAIKRPIEIVSLRTIGVSTMRPAAAAAIPNRGRRELCNAVHPSASPAVTHAIRVTVGERPASVRKPRKLSADGSRVLSEAIRK